MLYSFTVLPAKSDSDFMFIYKVIRDLKTIDHLCFYPIQYTSDVSICVSSSLSVRILVLLCNCKQRIEPLSLLVSSTVNQQVLINVPASYECCRLI